MVALAIAYAAIDPAGARSLTERLGLWPLVERLDQEGTRRLLGFIGKLLIVAAAALAVSVMTGHHGSAWLLPAGEAAFFGLFTWLATTFGGKH